MEQNVRVSFKPRVFFFAKMQLNCHAVQLISVFKKGILDQQVICKKHFIFFRIDLINITKYQVISETTLKKVMNIYQKYGKKWQRILRIIMKSMKMLLLI